MSEPLVAVVIAERDRARAKCEREQAEKREARGEREFFKLALEAVLDCLHWNPAAQRWLIAKDHGQRFSEAVEAARSVMLGSAPAHGRDLASLLRRLGKFPPPEEHEAVAAPGDGGQG